MARCSNLVLQQIKDLYGIDRRSQLELEMGRLEPHLFNKASWTDDEVHAIFAKYHKLVEIPITLEGFNYAKYQEEQINDRYL
jgi:hypothetical protein